MDSCISQTLGASPAEPGGLPDWASVVKHAYIDHVRHSKSEQSLIPLLSQAGL